MCRPAPQGAETLGPLNQIEINRKEHNHVDSRTATSQQRKRATFHRSAHRRRQTAFFPQRTQTRPLCTGSPHPRRRPRGIRTALLRDRVRSPTGHRHRVKPRRTNRRRLLAPQTPLAHRSRRHHRVLRCCGRATAQPGQRHRPTARQGSSSPWQNTPFSGREKHRLRQRHGGCISDLRPKPPANRPQRFAQAPRGRPRR